MEMYVSTKDLATMILRRIVLEMLCTVCASRYGISVLFCKSNSQLRAGHP